MTRRPGFWVAYALVSAIALGVAWRLFPLAIPLVNLDITMSRGAAIAQAEALAAQLKLAPDGAQSAVRFSHDGATQNYVELEGGGKAAFGALVKGDLYAPFWWEVRIFKPGEVNEATIRFRPDGASNGFVRRLPEAYVRDEATKALDPAAARALGEERAKADWNLDLAPYALLEQSQQTRPAGRVDHTFVYERAETLGDARIRLRLTVAGDELVEIAPYVHVPESFERRFRELRSANDTIAGIAGMSAGLLYGIGGCVLGVLWLARKHWLAVRPALRAGLVVGGLMALVTLAGSPRRMVRLRHRAVGDDVLAAAGRRGRCRRAGRRARVCAGVHGRGKPDPPRVSLAAAVVAGLVARRRRIARGAGPHGRRLPVRPGGARAGRRFLLRDEPLARLVATLRDADRSQHPVVRRAGADADRRVAAGRVHGGVPVSRRAARPGRADRRTFRQAQARDRRRVRAAGGRLRRSARQLPGVSPVLAPGRARRSFAALGGDLPSIRIAPDGAPARAVRSRALLDPAVSRRCAGCLGAARGGDRRGTGAAGGGAVASRERRRLGRAAALPAQWRVDAGRAAVAPRGARAGRRRHPCHGSRAAVAARARRRGSARVDRLHAPARRRAAAVPRPGGGRGGGRRRVEGARRHARPRVAPYVHGAARERRQAVVAAQVRLAGGGPGRLSCAHRQDACPAAVGSALRDVRRRCRGARGGMADHDRSSGHAAATPPCAARIATRRTPGTGGGARAGGARVVRAFRCRSGRAKARRRRGGGSACAHRLVVHVCRSAGRRGQGWRGTAVRRHRRR